MPTVDESAGFGPETVPTDGVEEVVQRRPFAADLRSREIPWERISATGASVISFAAMIVAMGPLLKSVEGEAVQATEAAPATADDASAFGAAASTPAAPALDIEVQPEANLNAAATGLGDDAADDSDTTSAPTTAPAAVAEQPQAEQVQTDQTPTDQPAVEEPPAPAAPTEAAPATETTAAPATDTTAAPAQSTSTAAAPTTAAPTTAAPTTAAPTTAAPTTAAPTTAAPTTAPPRTEGSG